MRIPNNAILFLFSIPLTTRVLLLATLQNSPLKKLSILCTVNSIRYHPNWFSLTCLSEYLYWLTSTMYPFDLHNNNLPMFCCFVINPPPCFVSFFLSVLQLVDTVSVRLTRCWESAILSGPDSVLTSLVML